MRGVRNTIAQIARFEDAAHLDAEGIVVVPGRGRFLDRTTLDVGGLVLRASKTILCTGSRPSVPDIPVLRDGPYLTNETLFDLTRLPQHLLVLGAGVTGLEMGQAFRRLGSEVTLIDAEQRLLAREDEDVVACAQGLLEREGLQFLLGAQVERVSASGATIAVEAIVDGGRRKVEGDALLVATGRRPNTETMGLEALGVEVRKHGIVVNEKLETTVEGIYAAGDVTGLYYFTHIAAYQGRIAAGNASGKGEKADYRVVPWVIFTQPEIAHVGLTEAEARERHGGEFRVVTLPYTAIDRAVIERQPRGLIKVIVGKKPLIGYALGEGEVIGAHLIGPLAGELLHEFVVTMQARAFTGRLAQAIHAYPTMSTGVQQAAGLLFPSGRATIDLREDLIL
jgi:pyruvate/2-oxoglutarate dehydrogenase complex dihydrolipoamide dehydrogenase (E3) component